MSCLLRPKIKFPNCVQDAVHLKGLRDDTTCIVVDILPLERTCPPVAPPKKQGMGVFKNIFRKKSSESSSHHSEGEYTELDIVEELFEDGSALLARRLICSPGTVFLYTQALRNPREIAPGMAPIFVQPARPRKKPWRGKDLQESVIKKKYGQDATSVGDEGGFVPNIQNRPLGLSFAISIAMPILLLRQRFAGQDESDLFSSLCLSVP
ncbi:putative protein phosphatase 2C 12 [Platanthera guangdongensis]|uniref:phosphopyruvate hydratase n=1 Tax=Platanthera guangdongensis TaxID=2320717 RepID=A0ABR2N4L8_9ASPA